jgi:hypothetical protein
MQCEGKKGHKGTRERNGNGQVIESEKKTERKVEAVKEKIKGLKVVNVMRGNT